MNGPYYRMAVFDFPYFLKNKVVYPTGVWRVKTAPSANEGSLSYQTTLLVDEILVAYDFNIPRRMRWTGEDIILTARVTESGIPLTNLMAAEAQVLFPRAALGTLLSVAKVKASEKRTDHISTKSQAKLLAMLQKPEYALRLRPQEISVTLYDDGRSEHGDAKEGDGIYSARFNNTQTPGLYRFFFTVKGATLSGWPFTRRQELSTIVRTRLSPEQTTVEGEWLKITNEGGTARIRITPLDQFGNFLGPGYDDRISLESREGATAAEVKDGLDGSYDLLVRVADVARDPRLDVKIFGISVFNDNLSKALVPRKRWGLSLHLGAAVPLGNFNTSYDSGMCVTADLERILNPHVSLEAWGGYLDFPSSTTGQTYWLHLSGNAKYFLGRALVKPFVSGGLGIYKTKNDSAVYMGMNAGAGISVRIQASLFGELGVNYHTVFTNGAATRFATIQAGIKWRF